MTNTSHATASRAGPSAAFAEAVRNGIRTHSAGGIAVFFIVVQIGCIVAGLLFPDQFRYLNHANIRVMLKAVAPLGIMSLGVGMLMIAGEFDLSVGAVYSFCAVFAASVVNSSFAALSPTAAPFVGLALALIVGALAGLANGFVTVRFAIPSFITTLGAMLLWQGGVLLYNGAAAVGFQPAGAFETLFAGQIGLFNAGFVWLAALAVACHVLLHHHRLGNHFYAVGGNAQAAIAIGIDPAKVKLIAFAITGVLSAFSGIIAMARVGSVQPGGGQGFELQAIAASVIGGVALTGGRGSTIGVLLGTGLVFTINDMLLLLRAPGFYFNMFVGALIVFAVIMNHAIRRRS